jgi:hypothetical protein
MQFRKCRISQAAELSCDNVGGTRHGGSANPRSVCTQGEVKVFDRRSKPSHGYRAVHLVVQLNRLRSRHGQNRPHIVGAELSERLADEFGDQPSSTVADRQMYVRYWPPLQGRSRSRTPQGHHRRAPHVSSLIGDLSTGVVEATPAAQRKWAEQVSTNMQHEFDSSCDCFGRRKGRRTRPE